jgi:hypothetical protein
VLVSDPGAGLRPPPPIPYGLGGGADTMHPVEYHKLSLTFFTGLQDHEFQKAFRMNRSGFDELKLKVKPYLQQNKLQKLQVRRISGSYISVTTTSRLVYYLI